MLLNRTISRLSSKSYYMRKLPDIYIRLASQEGKAVFRQALTEGNMQCYFPLAQQFTTQLEPSTCGPTSLVMVLNALGVDPQKQWKGIWRWYTEENLNLMTKQILKQGLHLESWTHIAKHNHLDVCTFYYPDAKILKDQILKPDCDCDNILQLKTASYETFRQCLISSARRQGFILTLNHSRRKMQQTGTGHYSPIGGFNQVRDLALVLDVARFKYPSYWCDTKRLFESLSEIDQDSQLPRGFVLVSRRLEQRAEICRAGLDYPTIRNFEILLKSLPPAEISDQFVLGLLNNFNEMYRSNLVYYLFELESHPKQYRDQLYETIRKNQQFLQFKQCLDSLKPNFNSDARHLQRLINEFTLCRFPQITFIMVKSMQKDTLTDLESQIRPFRRCFGLHPK